MPNWVKTKIWFEGESESTEKFINDCLNDEGNFDFEKIIPMPDYIYSGPLGLEEEKKYGRNNWYDWSIDNWGTKLNAESTFVNAEQGYVEFETAWSVAFPVLQKMAKNYIGTIGNRIIVEYADEDIGSNCASIIFEASDDDSLTYDIIYPDNPDRFALDVWEYEDEDLEW